MIRSVGHLQWAETRLLGGRGVKGGVCPRFRQVDMGHTLVQQLKKRDLVLAVVKERIITTSSCAITMIKKDQCITRGVLGIMGLLGKSTKVPAPLPRVL